ncbi:MAG: hypothetical protein U0T82_03040 [Bacteroidales bacterium]
MKKYLKILMILLISIIYPGGIHAQTGEELDNATGTSMMPIVNSLVDVVKAIEQSDVEIVHIEFDLIFENGKKEIFRTLSQGYTYGMMAYGDYRLGNVGIDLYTESEDSWEYVQSGQLTEGTMTLLYKVEETRQYKIVLRPLEFKEGYTAGHYGLVIIHDVLN